MPMVTIIFGDGSKHDILLSKLVKGNMVRLPLGGHVFVGKLDGAVPSMDWYIEFLKDGRTTHLHLSMEAADALCKLITGNARNYTPCTRELDGI